MLAGLKKRGSSGNTTPGERSSAAAACEQRRRGRSRRPALSHSRRHDSRIQRPITFFRKRIVPKAPPSFVKFARATASLSERRARARRPRATTCPRRCRPSRARAAFPRRRSPVSWVGGRDDPERPEPELASAGAGVELAERRPGRRRAPASARAAARGARRGRRPTLRVRTSRSCVVEAFVYSPRVEPQSAWWHEVRDHQQAPGARGQPLAHVGVELEERVELQELDARCAAKISSRGTSRSTRSMAPSVRWSRYAIGSSSSRPASSRSP